MVSEFLAGLLITMETHSLYMRSANLVRAYASRDLRSTGYVHEVCLRPDAEDETAHCTNYPQGLMVLSWDPSNEKATVPCS